MDRLHAKAVGRVIIVQGGHARGVVDPPLLNQNRCVTAVSGSRQAARRCLFRSFIGSYFIFGVGSFIGAAVVTDACMGAFVLQTNTTLTCNPVALMTRDCALLLR